MKREEIRELFMQGIDCSQVVTERFAQDMQMDIMQARKAAACFGGGMMCGETCGAVTGALMVIGMKYGHSEAGDMKQKEVMMEKTLEFKRLFAEKYSSCMCRDLIGHDIAKPGEMDKVLEEGILFEFCPVLVEDTIGILERIL